MYNNRVISEVWCRRYITTFQLFSLILNISVILLIRKINIYTFTEKNIKKQSSIIEFQSSNNVNQYVGNQKNLFQYVFIQSKYRKIGPYWYGNYNNANYFNASYSIGGWNQIILQKKLGWLQGEDLSLFPFYSDISVEMPDLDLSVFLNADDMILI